MFIKKIKMFNYKLMKTDDARRAIDHLSHSQVALKLKKKKEIMTLSYKMF